MKDPIDLAGFKNGREIFITPAALSPLLGRSSLVILDASSPEVYAKGHIPGAVNIGFHGLSSMAGTKGDPGWGTILGPAELAKKLGALGIGADSFVVVYSDILAGPGSCGRTLWQLRVAGLENNRLLSGGLEAWRRSGFPLSTKAARPRSTPGPSLAAYDDSMRSSKEAIVADHGRTTLIDVRSAAEFSGEDQSRGESRPGHLRDAVSMPWKTLLEEDGSPKSPERIIALLAKHGVERGDNFVVY